MRGVGRPPLDREAAFRRLFAEHYRHVLAYALRRCEQRADAEDVVAGTFAVAWRRFADAPAEELRLAWLYAIAARVLAKPAAVGTAARGAAVAAACSSARPAGGRGARRRAGGPSGASAGGSGGPPSGGVGGAHDGRARDGARLLGERGRNPTAPGAQAARGPGRERIRACRTFSGRRHRVNETDAMRLLAEATRFASTVLHRRRKTSSTRSLPGDAGPGGASSSRSP